MALSNTLWLLKDAAQQTFFDVLKNRGDKLLRYPPLVPVDLSPPLAVREGIFVLLEIIETYNGMMVPASGNKPNFDPVISALLDPIVQMCEQAAEEHKSKAGNSLRRSRTSSDAGQFGGGSPSPVDAILTSKNSISSLQSSEMTSKIFLINCLCAIQQPLVGHDVAAGYVRNLGSKIEKHVNGLVEKEAEAILRRCCLLVKVSRIHSLLCMEENGKRFPLAEVEDMSPASLSESLRGFFGLVLGSEGSLPEFEQMQVPNLRSEASIGVARSHAQAYKVIYEAIMDPNNRYPDPKSLARHPLIR